MLKKFTIDPADEQYVTDILKGAREQAESPVTDKLNTETFRHYEKQRTSDEERKAEMEKHEKEEKKFQKLFDSDK